MNSQTWYSAYCVAGLLNVYLHSKDSSLLFSLSGNQGDDWRQAIVPLPSVNSSFQVNFICKLFLSGNMRVSLSKYMIVMRGDVMLNKLFQIVIEGVRGAGYEGDTAVDDVQLAEGDECIGLTTESK